MPNPLTPTNATQQTGSRPVPDPTVLTTEQLLRAVEAVREVIGATRQILETRLDGMDRAIELLQKASDQLPDYVKEHVAGLQELHEEKFTGVQTQFRERDTRTDQTAKDSKVAVDAALSAAKEIVEKQNTANTLAINKSEAAFTKQLDQIGLQIGTIAKGMDDKVADIKDRITTIESKTSGMAAQKVEQTQGTKDNVGYVVAAVSVIFGVISIAALAISIFKP